MPATQQFTPFSTIIDGLNRDLGLTEGELAMMLGTTVKMVERWHSGLVAPSPLVMERLDRIERIHQRLFHIFKVHDVLDWLRTSNENLNWLSPAAALVAGDFQRVDAAIDKIGYRLYR